MTRTPPIAPAGNCQHHSTSLFGAPRGDGQTTRARRKPAPVEPSPKPRQPGPPASLAEEMLTGGLPRGSGGGEVSDSVAEGDPLRSRATPHSECTRRARARSRFDNSAMLCLTQNHANRASRFNQSLRHTRCFSMSGGRRGSRDQNGILRRRPSRQRRRRLSHRRDFAQQHRLGDLPQRIPAFRSGVDPGLEDQFASRIEASRGHPFSVRSGPRSDTAVQILFACT